MNIFRSTAIALSLTLLVACGSGESGEDSVADSRLQSLSDAPINTEIARSYFTESTIPATMASDAIEEVFQS